MKNKSHAIAPKEGALKTYTLAFLASIFLTLAAYFIVIERLFSAWALVTIVVALGIIQAFVQLIFFLHLGKEGKPHWNMTAFLFMVMVIAILAGGTVWIMHSLTGRLMAPMEMHHHHGM